MSEEQRDLFETKTITVGEIIERWERMLNHVGSEINRLDIKSTMLRYEEEDGKSKNKI